MKERRLMMPSTSHSAQWHVFPLIIAGGCLLNFDRLHPPIDEQMRWLRQVGFKDVKCFWRDANRALFGGFKLD
jgi:hypothetical protein